MNKVEISGYWNVPGYEEYDAEGVLHLDPVDGVINLLVYSSKPIGLMKEFETITGRSTRGSEITLYECYAARENIRVVQQDHMKLLLLQSMLLMDLCLIRKMKWFSMKFFLI